MKLGRIIAAAATSGLLLSGAFVVAEEYTGHNVFAVNLDNSNKIELKTKKGTVREVLIANDIPFGADDRVEPGLDTKVNGGETISIYKAHEVTIVDGDTTTVRKTTYKKVGDILKELNITLGENDRVTPDLNKEVAKACPLDKLLIETDCPYLTPTPYRGKRNEPAYVHYVAQEIADLKEMSYEQLTKQTFNNACTLFGLEDKKEID